VRGAASAPPTSKNASGGGGPPSSRSHHAITASSCRIAPARSVGISVAGGSEPQWRTDGGELFFIDADQTLVAATLTTGQPLAVRRLERLFRARFDATSRYGPSYAVHPDGQRFLINEAVDSHESLLTVLERWGVTRP